MLIVRQTFQAKYGHGDELVALFKEFNKRMRESGGAVSPFRILTDASGPFFKVVTEIETENFAEWESGFSETMNQPWMGEWFGKMMPLVESGSRDFYNLVE